MTDLNNSTREEVLSKNGFKKGVIWGCIISAIICIAIAMATGMLPIKSQSSDNNKLSLIKSLVKQYYLYGNQNNTGSEEDIYKSYVSSLGDPYSEYMTKEEFTALKNATSGHFFGIGVKFQQNQQGEILVNTVFEDTPAHKAGILTGDKLIKVDGKSVEGRKVQDVVAEIKGEENTKVEVEFYRVSTDETIVKNIERKEIKLQSVESNILENGIGYIKITEFTGETANQYKDAISKLEKEGAKALVIDLRDNPGGVIATTVSILDDILPRGKVVYTKDKNGKAREWNSDEENQYRGKVAVLINENSASASEIFAGAIQDFEKGKIIGKTSYGKGVVQQIMDLPDGSGLKLTISEYFTPKGQRINKKGVVPDIEISNDGSGEDMQLQKAVEVLKQ